MLVLHSGEAQVPVMPKRPSDRPIIQNEGGGRTDASEEVVYGLDYVFIIIVQCSNHAYPVSSQRDLFLPAE